MYEEKRENLFEFRGFFSLNLKFLQIHGSCRYIRKKSEDKVMSSTIYPRIRFERTVLKINHQTVSYSKLDAKYYWHSTELQRVYYTMRQKFIRRRFRSKNTRQYKTNVKIMTLVSKIYKIWRVLFMQSVLRMPHTVLVLTVESQTIRVEYTNAIRVSQIIHSLNHYFVMCVRIGCELTEMQFGSGILQLRVVGIDG